MHKLENPLRVAELKPAETLRRAGLTPDANFLDVGAGTGLFAFEAANMTCGTVYAVEISADMLKILNEKRENAGHHNVHIIQGVENAPSGAFDLALLCTVLHELDQPEYVLGQIRRALKPGGRLAVIEFHGRTTPMGPPEAVRIGEEAASRILTLAGFLVEGSYTLGDNFYCLTARPILKTA